MANFHVLADAKGTRTHPVVRQIGVADVFDSLRRGFEDFWEKPSHYVFLCLIYPVVGAFLFAWASGENILQLVFPLMSGFALLGPFAALGLYEISRRRELNLDNSWWHALEVRNSPALPAIAALGGMLLVLFLVWLFTAQALYTWLFGSNPPESFTGFLAEVFTTRHGWALIILGHAIGAVFALIALTTTVIAFPLLLDRDVGALAAVEASAKSVLRNPVPMLLWGAIVAAGLMIGSVPFFFGLAIVLPVLGHATWHLYRKVIEPPAVKRRRARR